MKFEQKTRVITMVVYLQNLTLKNPSLDLVNINAKFGRMASISSQDIEWKQNSDNNQRP